MKLKDHAFAIKESEDDKDPKKSRRSGKRKQVGG